MRIKRTDVNTHEQTSTERGMRPLKSHRLGNQMDQLQASHNDLANRVSELKGNTTMIGLVFLGISMVFGILSGLAGYKIYDAKTTNDRNGQSELLTGLIEDGIDRTLNGATFGSQPYQQPFTLQELADMQKRFTQLNVESKELVDRIELAAVMISVMENNNDDEAREQLEVLRNRTAYSDPFVFARASTLLSILLVRPTRTCENPATKPLVAEAVKRDPRLAAAYNILGLCLAEEAVALAKSQSEDDWQKAIRNMQEAFVYYDLSYTLKPSAWARSKSLNNKVWSTMVLFESVLENDARSTHLLALNKHPDFEHFVNDSLDRLGLCNRLSENPVWFETEAELHGLRNAYYNRMNQPEAAAAATVEMKKAYGGAIRQGLFAGRRRREEAIDYFKSDTLLEKLHSDREILQLIEKSVGNGM